MPMDLFRALRTRRARRLGEPLPPWQPQEAGDGHIVQFYGGRFPAEAVAGFMRDGIAAGEVCVVIAEPHHVAAIDRLLDRPGKCVYLDAERTLSKFLVHGHPDRLRFLDTVGDLIEQAAQAGGGKVRVFGEMVALLAQHGEPEAAKELEALWNELADRHDLRLLCTYPIDALGGRNRPHAASLRDAHTHTVPLEAWAGP